MKNNLFYLQDQNAVRAPPLRVDLELFSLNCSEKWESEWLSVLVSESVGECGSEEIKESKEGGENGLIVY